MEAKIRVYGSAQNRIALGIANAYVRLNPDSTIGDLNRAFPETINNATSSDLFALATDEDLDAQTKRKFFEKADELIVLKDGTKVMMFEAWSKADYERIVEHAKQYQIEVAPIEQGELFKKGGFRLEEINKKKCKWWIWLIILLILIIVLFLLFRSCNKEIPAPQPPAVAAVDTIKPEPKINLQEKFTSIQFNKKEFKVSEASKPALIEMANVLKEFDKATLKVQGHASKDGSLEFNKKLSEKRAKSVADFIISQGVAANRITSVGMGIDSPIDNSNLEPNRRVDFIVTE